MKYIIVITKEMAKAVRDWQSIIAKIDKIKNNQ